MMKKFSLWGLNTPSEFLSQTDKEYHESLHENLSAEEWVWAEKTPQLSGCGINYGRELSSKVKGMVRP